MRQSGLTYHYEQEPAIGFDCGFDIYPRLEATASNKESYSRFLDEVIQTYENEYDEDGRRPDSKVLEFLTSQEHGDNIYLSIMVGECPRMPCNPEHCYYFLRVSSKVSGHLTAPARPYIKTVGRIAKKYFAEKVYFWHENCETGDEREGGSYGWRAVHEADNELRKLASG